MISLRILQAIKPSGTILPTASSLLTRTNQTDFEQKRTVIYYDRNTANRLTDKDAVQRFYRLHWGGWIRTRAGRKNHLWKKPWYIKWYTRQHVFCTPQMCEDLEKLIAPDIKKPRHFIDDIYAPYNKRHGLDFCPRDKKQVSRSYVKMREEY